MITLIRRNLDFAIVAAVAVMLALVVCAFTVDASENPSTQGLQIMLNAASANNATGTTVGTGTMSRCRESAIYIQWSAGTASGGVTVETAHDAAYTGTWAPLGAAIAWSAVSKEDLVQITGVHGAVRTRISTVIAGGTVSSWMVCN